MITDTSTMLSLNSALMLPLLVLYVLILIRFLSVVRFLGAPLISLRDAAVATIALDFAPLANVYPTLIREGGMMVPLVIVGFAAMAHLFALVLILRRSEGGEPGSSKFDGVITDALDKFVVSKRSTFPARLSSLYIATLLLVTNGTTVLAVLEMVKATR